MSAGDGNWTAVFSGTVNRRPPAVAGAEGVGASLDGSNCHGVSGEAGAKSRVSLQAPSSTNPAAVPSTPDDPASWLTTQTSQALAAYIGNASACRSTSIQRPGFGAARPSAGMVATTA